MSTTDKVKRDILPIPDHLHTGLITFDAKDPDSHFEPIEPLRPPEGAPNVLVVLLDDVGFGASSTFGGPVNMPTAERLANTGLKYNRFHTTALCAPTRMALLTGRNHHTVGMGSITEQATSAPGYTSVRPRSCAPLPETLRLNGYSTAQFGKCHEVPVWETSPMGPFDRWPTNSGFEYFYGFIGGETDNYYPTLFENTTPVEADRTPEEGYHLSEDLVDRSIKWVRQQKLLTKDKPFFLYLAPVTAHSPHQVGPEWSDKYKGQFDQGWDQLREEIFARQKDLGVIPPDAELTARHAGIPAWDEMPDELKPVLIRQMEIYAGFLEHFDHHLGRLIDTLETLEVLDNTLIYYIIGDNGASAEGSLQGTFSEITFGSGFAHLETTEFLLDRLDEFGGPTAHNHYAVGWAHALDTPYQWTKQVASHFGGTRNGLVVHWPQGIEASGELRNQFHHVIDVAPTILEAAGIPEPTMVNSIQQKPIEGVSMAYSFDQATAAERRETQYFEMVGNRGIYHKGWTAVTRHRTPWITTSTNLTAFDDDVWELYDTNVDWTQANDLAQTYPEKLHELQRLWLIEAVRHNVLPLDDRFFERMVADVAGRPAMITGNHQFFFGGMDRLPEQTVLSTTNRSHTITAEVAVPENGAEGVIMALGGHPAGFSLYTKGGKLKYCYNFLGLQHTYIEGTTVLPSGTHQVRMAFDYDGGGSAKGATISLYLDGDKVGEGRVEQTLPLVFAVNDTCDIGHQRGSLVTHDYGRDNAFSGNVNWVQLAIEDTDDADNYVSREQLFKAYLAMQ